MSLHLSKCHIVGNHMLRLIYFCVYVSGNYIKWYGSVRNNTRQGKLLYILTGKHPTQFQFYLCYRLIEPVYLNYIYILHQVESEDAFLN